MKGVHEGMLLVGRQLCFEHVVVDGAVLALDPLAGSPGCLARHVLTRCVTGRVVEAGVDKAAGDETLDPVELAGARGRLSYSAYLPEMLIEPVDEVACLTRGVEEKGGGPLHRIVDHGDVHPTGFAQQFHSPVVGGDQGAFGRGHRHVEPIGTWATPVKLSMLPGRVAGSTENDPTWFRSAPDRAPANLRRASAASAV